MEAPLDTDPVRRSNGPLGAPNTDNPNDLKALTEAFELFVESSAKMEEAYRLLEARVQTLDRELAAKNHELAVTTDYLSNLLESMSDGVIAVDPAGSIIRFNRSASAVLGYTAKELIGKPFDDVFGRAFTAPQLPGAMELRAKSGRLVPVSERDSTVTDGAQKCLGNVKTFQDLSELVALREQVRQIDRLAAIGEMAATVAHEIRNPLGGIRGFAMFLQQDTPETDPRRRLVDKIIEGTQNLEKVVNELLEYTRPVELKLHPEPCAQIVGAAISMLPIENSSISLLCEIDPGLKVLADAGKMRQVLLNVLMNAIQSIENAGEVHVSAIADDSHVTLHIRDTGCGMTAEQLQRVFSPFYTTKEKGTGLGLAVSAKILDGHAGSITATSEAGQGSTFSIRIARAE